MRALLVSMLLAAAAAAEPAHDAPTGSANIDVTELTISAGSGVGPAILRRAFDDVVDAAARCYGSVKSKPEKLRATVTLKFRIDDHGAVSTASAAGLPSVNSCIAAAIKGLVFDPPNKGTIDVTEKLALSTPVGILGAARGSAAASLTSTGDISSDEEANLHGGMIGGETRGGFSAPGSGWGTIGIVRVTDGEPTAPADKDAIRNHVHQNLGLIDYCYELELVTHPRLAGSVTIVFRIEPDGNVSSAKGSGLPGVDECAASAISALVFPRPSTGAAIDVRFPLVFKPDPSPVRTPVPSVTIGQITAQGDLVRPTIRRYIKRNLQKIQYCYEMQLVTKPRLAGTVQAAFAIGGDGKVTTSTASGVDPTVARCIADLIQQIEFPKPKDGGVVQVTFPLVFRTESAGK